MKKIALIAAASSLALALSACGGGKSEEAPVDTNVSNLEVSVNETGVMNETTAPAPASNVTAPAARGSDFSNTAQTQDDAEATGMTSRVSREDDNSSQPTH